MVEIPNAAQDQYAHIQSLQLVALKSARRSWGGVDPNRISETWLPKVRRDLTPVVTAAQINAATAGSDYSAMTLAQQGTYSAPTAYVDPRAFGGYAADGRSLETMLDAPAYRAKQLIGSGVSVPEAMSKSSDFLDVLIASTITDAARQSASVDIATRPSVGYTRMLNPPSCSRCTILAGRFYRWNKGFRRHPSCFPAGTVVSGPAPDAATRRWYEGELAIIRTASGKELTATANHPILTDQGWVPAGMLNEGDNVVSSTAPDGAVPLVVPNEKHAPSLIEDVWGANGMVPLGAMPTSAEDFHGDGGHGDVDTVLSDRLLGHGSHARSDEGVEDVLLSTGLNEAVTLAGFGAGAELVVGQAHSLIGTMRSVGLSGPFWGAHLGGAREPGLGMATNVAPEIYEPLADDVPTHARALGEFVLARSGLIVPSDGLDIERNVSPRWDAPAGPISVESSSAYASRGKDLGERLASQVELDRVVDVSLVEWSGHVYNLTSSEGWYSANGLIVSNCDCVHVATSVGSTQGALSEGLIQDPYEYFNSLSEAQQTKLVGKFNATAIRDGADISQVVNAASRSKRIGMFTTAGTTKRGYAGSILKPGQRRMTPDAIYRLNPTKEGALADLKAQGYLLPQGQVATGAIRGQVEGFGALGAGGQRRAASQSVLDARATGIRDPNVRYTMTASERRVYDAKQRYETALSGRDPFTSPGFGNTPDPYGVGTNTSTASFKPVTPKVLAQTEQEYRRQLIKGGEIFTN